MSESPTTTVPSWWRWLVLAVAVGGLLLVVWALVTDWGGVVHGHPAYAVMLALTVLGSAAVAWRARRPLPPPDGWRRVGGIALVVAGVAWIALAGWLRPFSAVEPSLTAMRSDGLVSVTEHPTQIVLTPSGSASDVGVFFQPGARVDARAYAAVLRPLAEAGHTVVVAKQPLGIAFFALNAFESTRSARPEVARWVVGGHSLGGTVAAMNADAADADPTAPAVGLLLYASYPAGDVSTSLTAAVASVSGSQDGLATPAKIDASRSDLPADATFTVVEGASHAQFGDYGAQPGDGTPTIGDDEARSAISDASVGFVGSLPPSP